MSYHRQYTPRFAKNLQRFQISVPALKNVLTKLQKTRTKIQNDSDARAGGLNLKGCRSARVGRNFRILFVVCEECRQITECEYCLCEGLTDQTVVFLTINAHDKAYEMK